VLTVKSPASAAESGLVNRVVKVKVKAAPPLLKEPVEKRFVNVTIWPLTAQVPEELAGLVAAVTEQLELARLSELGKVNSMTEAEGTECSGSKLTLKYEST